MLLKRVRIALDLSIRFFFHPGTLTIVAVPLIAWPLKRLFIDHVSLGHDLLELLGLYAVLCAGVFLWKFAIAPRIIAGEPALYAQISQLDAQEQQELKRLVRAGRIEIGPPLLERIAAKTEFIFRDLSGEWRVEREHRRFLKDWERQSRQD